MSTQKGNTRRTRPPKYKNTVAYKNSLHDTSKRTHEINSLTMSALCTRCKGILEWKVKYKKYKPLTQPTVCLKCNQKTVKRAYYTVCTPCIEALGVCGKCGTKAELVIPPNEKTQEQINMEFEAELKRLRERERRTLLRCAAKGIGGPTDERESVTSESEDYVSRGSRSPGDIGAQLGRLRVNKGEHSCSSDLEEDSSSDDDPGDS